MKKEENVFIPGIKLFIICLFVALGLSALNFITEPIISAANELKKQEISYEGRGRSKIRKYCPQCGVLLSPCDFG